MGLNNPMGLPSDVEKILFHPFYTVKDLSGNDFVFVLMVFFLHYFSEAENFKEAESLVTPIHICVLNF